MQGLSSIEMIRILFESVLNRKGDTWWIQYLDEYGGDAYKRIVEMGKIAKQKGVIKGYFRENDLLIGIIRIKQRKICLRY